MREEDLLLKLKNQPDAGMRILIDEYAGLVYSVVRGRLSPALFCEADVEGCVADVFSEFYCDLARYDPEQGSIRSWLCVIARHNALDLLRKRQKDRGSVALDEDCAELFSVEEDLLDSQMRKELLQAIQRLGDPDREIIVRKFYLEQSSREIARRLKMTVSNVDTRTHRALKKLRDLFGGEWK